MNKNSPILKLYASVLAAIGAFALFPPSASAIVNVEQAIIGKPSEGFHASMDLLASGASGNTNTSSTKANLLSLFQHGEHTEFLQLQYAYGKSDGQVDTDHAFAHLRHRTAINQDWAVEGFAQVGRDPFARLTRRTLFGGGMRWAILEQENRSAVYLGFGVFHEYEILTDTLGTDDPREENLWRANSYLVFKHHLDEQVGLYSTTYYQPAFSETADYRLLEQASVLVKLRDDLDFKISLDYSFDSMPPQTVQKRDLTYSTGLEFSF
ncbi:MAG TPA: DUF481 domain-containing protein [Gallionella sp.]|nr:DUF481 domain-containing protein [Gallionella sp.]